MSNLIKQTYLFYKIIFVRFHGICPITKNILRDLLGDRMSLIHEYAENKVNQEQIRIIRNLLRRGMRAEVVAKSAEVPLSRVKAIERKMKK